MSSPSSSDGPAPPPARRYTRQKRGVSPLNKQPSALTDVYLQKLRNGTFILPGTGERVRRQITLRNPANFDGPPRQFLDDEVDPHFPLRRARSYSQAGTFRTAMDNTVQSAKEFWAYLKTPTAKGILKCSLAVRTLCPGPIPGPSSTPEFEEHTG
jgi:hypothetical protein